MCTVVHSLLYSVNKNVSILNFHPEPAGSIRCSCLPSEYTVFTVPSGYWQHLGEENKWPNSLVRIITQYTATKDNSNTFILPRTPLCETPSAHWQGGWYSCHWATVSALEDALFLSVWVDVHE